MIISDFSAGAKAGFHSDRAIIWSQEYQARVYTKRLAMLEKSAYVNGFTPWISKDFRSHLRELNGIQETFNRKGLVSETGEKKIAFGVLSKFYRKQSAETGERFSEAKSQARNMECCCSGSCLSGRQGIVLRPNNIPDVSAPRSI
jgi:beta-glucuronidase